VFFQQLELSTPGNPMIRELALTVAIVLITTPAAEASARNFFSPVWNGNRLAACLSVSAGCGKAAADLFCKSQGYDDAVLFQREPSAMTVAIGTGEICEGMSCTAFKQIKCQSVKNDLGVDLMIGFQ
jgi:hypothetical protein